MKAKRFAKVIDAVRERKPARFSMAGWKQHHTCGTVCCAIGSFCEANPRAALKADLAGQPHFRGYFGFRAVGEYLDIPTGDAIDLFGPSYLPKAAVLGLLKRYLRKHK